MANYIFKESIPKIAEFFYLFFIYFYPSFWTYYETWMRISTLKSQNWTFLAVFNLCIIIKILYDFWVRIKPKEPKPKKTVIYISVIPPPKFLSVSFCSIFILYVVSLVFILFYFINYYLCLCQYRRTKIKKNIGGPNSPNNRCAMRTKEEWDDLFK